MGTGLPKNPTSDLNFSPDYENYIRERIKQSPLDFTGNKFFPESTLIQQPTE